MSRYVNAAEILPACPLEALQQYAEGIQLYIPRRDERAAWGQLTGARQELAQRNWEIRQRRLQGASIESLMSEFHLSHDSIRKIVCGKNSSTQS